MQIKVGQWAFLKLDQEIVIWSNIENKNHIPRSQFASYIDSFLINYWIAKIKLVIRL